MKTKLIALLLLFIPVVAWADPSPTPAPQDKLQVALADMVNKSVQVAGDAKDFLVAQLPDVIRQLLAWKATEAGVKGFILAVLSGLLMWCSVKSFKWSNREGEEIGFAVGTFSIAGSVGIGFAASTYLLTVLQIWLAPKIYLLEYSKNLITGH